MLLSLSVLLLAIVSVSCLTKTVTRLSVPFRNGRFRVTPLKSTDGSQFEGQFVPISNIEAIVPDSLPFGIAVAGFTVNELEDVVDNICGTLITDRDGRLVRTIVFDEGDKKLKLKDLLSENSFLARDHEIPKIDMRVSVPFILLSGFSKDEISGFTKLFRKYYPREIIFAVAVTKALDKTLAQLYDEILGDYDINKKRRINEM